MEIIRIRGRGIITLPKKVMKDSGIKEGDYCMVYANMNQITFDKVDITKSKQEK